MDKKKIPKPTQLNKLVLSGVKRPWICTKVRQVAVLVRDSSISMRGAKAQLATEASQDLIAELAAPYNKDGFYAAIIDFSFVGVLVHPLQKATLLAGLVKQIQVQAGTCVTAGLEKALKILEQAEKNQEQGYHYLKPVVICFSDGCHNFGEEPYDVADIIKQSADLVTVAYGDDADEGLLKKLATTSQHFYRCKAGKDGKDLRMFLAAVGETMSHTMAARKDSTKALSEIQLR